jgi:hypothetical protein
MTDIVDIAHYARARDIRDNTAFAAASVGENAWYKSTPLNSASDGYLSASVLRKLDHDSELGRFVGLIDLVLERCLECQHLMKSGDLLGADDQFIGCKPILTEMFMFRDLSDAVGLIVLKCLQVAASVAVIVDAPELPKVLERALTRVRAAPFMSFQQACSLSDDIEASASLSPLPGFFEVSNALVETFQDFSERAKIND